ncbi:MAG TPA: divalent-cation tolerance protein CutA [Methylophilaceae bacterium]|nr:divalent-cation tolerance protein CutA [Methylophilaceae bacterium]HAJ72865.1 divalent-cation tolerance protein CutA [Methylophilaceae bacterium]
MCNQETILVLTNVPNEDCANEIADALIKLHLAACVNILSPCQSVYRWKGNIERTTEIPMMIKTHRLAYAEVEKIILTMHPYELPEIISLNVDGGLPAYLQWVSAQLLH